MTLFSKPIVMKACSRCGGEFDEEAFFRSNSRVTSTLVTETKPVCIGCEQTARDIVKEADRWRAKAHNTINHHCNTYNRKHNTSLLPAEFRSRFGWLPDRIAKDMQHAYENGCQYCRRLYKSMKHGLSDITIDIVTPDRDPYYATNKTFCCQTCNREKGKTSPDLWARKLMAWEQWEAHQLAIEANPLAGLPLFLPRMAAE